MHIKTEQGYPIISICYIKQETAEVSVGFE